MEKYKKDIVSKTQELIKFKSVESQASENAPFGKGNLKALEYMLSLGKADGFTVKNIDGYAGHIEYNPSSAKEVFAVLTHLDVVPEGDGWKYDPYGGELVDGKIYGRGAIDNKGPTIASYYAIKALKDEGFKSKYAIRLIMGCDEESGFNCVKHYLTKETQPSLAFTPDSEFPLINAEKGILQYDFITKIGFPVIKSIKGGMARNAVCDKVLLTFKDGKEQTFTGKSAHASRPLDGENAAYKLISHLYEISQNHLSQLKEDKTTTKEQLQQTEFNASIIKALTLLTDTNGKAIGSGFKDLSGELTHNIGMIEYADQTLKVTLDIRYPVTVTFEQVDKIYRNALGKLFDINIHSHKPPLLVEADSLLVKNLLSSYQAITGKKGKPLSTGGGTYSRALPNGTCVAFGVRFEHNEDLAHKPNEYIVVDDLITASKIIKKAIEKCCQ